MTNEQDNESYNNNNNKKDDDDEDDNVNDTVPEAELVTTGYPARHYLGGGCCHKYPRRNIKKRGITNIEDEIFKKGAVTNIGDRSL